MHERRAQRFFDFDEDDRFEYALKTPAGDKRAEAEQIVRRIVEEQLNRARAVLTEHRGLLEAMALALLERETLDAEEIQATIEGRPLPEREKVVIPSWSDKDKTKKEQRRAASIFTAPKPATSG